MTYNKKVKKFLKDPEEKNLFFLREKRKKN